MMLFIFYFIIPPIFFVVIKLFILFLQCHTMYIGGGYQYISYFLNIHFRFYYNYSSLKIVIVL